MAFDPWLPPVPTDGSDIIGAVLAGLLTLALAVTVYRSALDQHNFGLLCAALAGIGLSVGSGASLLQTSSLPALVIFMVILFLLSAGWTIWVQIFREDNTYQAHYTLVWGGLLTALSGLTTEHLTERSAPYLAIFMAALEPLLWALNIASALGLLWLARQDASLYKAGRRPKL
jgi:hypothetical protein